MPDLSPTDRKFLERYTNLLQALRQQQRPGGFLGQVSGAAEPWADIGQQMAQSQQARQQQQLTTALGLFGRAGTEAGVPMGLGELLSRVSQREFRDIKPYIPPKEKKTEILVTTDEEIRQAKRRGLTWNIKQPILKSIYTTVMAGRHPLKGKEITRQQIGKQSRSEAERMADDLFKVETTAGIVLNPKVREEYTVYLSAKDKERYYFNMMDYAKPKVLDNKAKQGKAVYLLNTQEGIGYNQITDRMIQEYIKDHPQEFRDAR